jgi:hypothetical protein
MKAFQPLAAMALMVAQASSANPSSPQPAMVIVELFTSEACSSCPPADALLARLSQEGPPGVRVLGLSEHVDYWDGPGWRDPFGSRRFSERQEAYASRLGGGAIYTPQAVVAGNAQVLGSDETALRGAILHAAREPAPALSLRRTPGGVDVEGSWPGGLAEVRVALVEDGVESVVSGGENAGRTLRHEGVVRWLGVAGAGDGSFRGNIGLPALGGRRRLRAIAFAQAPRTGRIVAAGELREPLVQ